MCSLLYVKVILAFVYFVCCAMSVQFRRNACRIVLICMYTLSLRSKMSLYWVNVSNDCPFFIFTVLLSQLVHLLLVVLHLLLEVQPR